MVLFIYIFIYIWLAVFGACIGSFLNVVIYRLPKKIFFGKSRSYCPKCKTQLKWYDLIPIGSYIFLKGKCRYCKSRISLKYPVTEAFCAVLAILCFMRFGIGELPRAAITFGMSATLLSIAAIDFETLEIPDSLIIAIIPFTVGSIWIYPDISVIKRIIGFFAVSLPLLSISLIIKNAFGGGDIKLMAVCGFMLGWQNTLLAFLTAVLIGGGYAVYLLARGKINRKAHIAFGPYLCIGIAVAMFFGDEIISVYLNLFLG